MNCRKDEATCVYAVRNKKGVIARYAARTIINKRVYYLGCYKTKQEAIEAYQAFKKTGKNVKTSYVRQT